MNRFFIHTFLVTIFYTAQVVCQPPMGWNSWNHYGRNIDQNEVVKTIDILSSNGFVEAGYEYVVIDGGWRDNQLNADGTLKAHPIKFSQGITSLVRFANKNGLKMGLHIVPGKTDCAGEPVGGLGRERLHINQLVSWGVNYIKLDCCGCEKEQNHKGFTSREEQYLFWSELVKNSGSEILFSGSSGKKLNPTGIYSEEVKNNPAWNQEEFPLKGIFSICRTTKDIKPIWKNKANSILTIADINNSMAHLAGGGYWNDPDMLEVGNGNLTIEQQKAHFALWCIMTAPLMLGNRLVEMSVEEKRIVLNREAIRVNQDTTEQGIKIAIDGKKIKPIAGYANNQTGETEVWCKRLNNGEFAVLLLNRSDHIKANFHWLGTEQLYNVYNIFSATGLGQYRNSFDCNVDANSGFFILLKP
jgi:alpha-galactosidase